MSPSRNKGDSRVPLPHHPTPSQPVNGSSQNGTTQQSRQVGPTTTVEEWDRIELQYWADAKKAAQLEDKSMGDKYLEKTAPIKAKYAPLLERRARLEDELAAIKAELDAVQVSCNEMDDELTQIDMHYFEAKDIIEKRRADQNQRARECFSTYKEMARQQAAGLLSEADKCQLQMAASGAFKGSLAASSASDDSATDERNGHAGVDVQSASSHTSPLSQPPDDNTHTTGVQVFSSDGKFIDNVKKINLSNRHVRNILQILPKRSVVVREGRKFTKETMASIYEPSDVKGAKWLSCMIQATGEEQDIPCEPCRNKSGTWAGCVIVGGVDFPRCANCEWNRQGCVGSSYHQDRSQDPDLPQGPQSPYVFSDASAPVSREGSYTQGFTPVNGAALRGDSANSTPAPLRTSLPTAKGARNPLPTMAPNIPYEDPFHGAAEEQLDPGPEIVNGSLHLENDGEVFTAPAIMAGVPVERISPNHPYWDKTWEPVEPSIQAKLDEWKAKLAQCMITQPKKRFLAQRQVNRGTTILEFLANGPIHPYQLVSKKFISKALISYDTVFRLAQVIEELPKFGVNVDPVDWVRERMHQLYTEQGESFSLARTVHDLYRDAKLQFLRNRAGYGNIGRPCGVKKGMTSKYPGGIRPKDPRLPPPPRAKRNGPSLENKAASKKQRVHNGNAMSSPPIKSETASPQALSVGSFDPEDGYTSTDTASGEGISELDWRIVHLKTETSQPEKHLAQYWHFVHNGARPFFEHQLITGQKGDKWMVYPEPHNFSLYLHEIDRIQSCFPHCLKLVIHTIPVDGNPPRGRILVEFKRPRTVKRFLSFFKNRKPVEVVPQAYIEQEWEKLDVPVSHIPSQQ